MSEKPTHVRGKSPKEDLIYDRLIELIIDKFLRPGQRLNEAKLAEAYNVPRSRVRRVLERLRDEEILVFELNRGAFLCRPTVAEAHHVFETRRHLEYAAARIACERATPKDIQLLRDHVMLERQAFESGRRDANRVAAEFHDLLADVTGNPILKRMLSGLVRRGVLIQSIYEIEGGVLCLTGEHAAIVDAIEHAQPERAIEEMARHFDHIISSLDLSEERQNEVDIYAETQ